MGVQSQENWERFGAMRSDSVGFWACGRAVVEICAPDTRLWLLSRVRAVLALDA
jgi:hypothetical protein